MHARNSKPGSPAPLSTEDLIKNLNGDLSREYQAIISYIVYSQSLKGPEFMTVADELEQHAGEELQHAIKIAKQIDYLGGAPTATAEPVKLTAGNQEMLRADLESENETIRNYLERVKQCELLSEYATAETIREILIDEQDHQIALATALGISVPRVGMEGKGQ